jgi:hypothetical protein
VDNKWYISNKPLLFVFGILGILPIVTSFVWLISMLQQAPDGQYPYDILPLTCLVAAGPASVLSFIDDKKMGLLLKVCIIAFEFCVIGLFKSGDISFLCTIYSLFTVVLMFAVDIVLIKR